MADISNISNISNYINMDNFNEINDKIEIETKIDNLEIKNFDFKFDKSYELNQYLSKIISEIKNVN